MQKSFIHSLLRMKIVQTRNPSCNSDLMKYLELQTWKNEKKWQGRTETRTDRHVGRNSDVDKDGLMRACIQKYQTHDLSCK